MGLFKRWTNKEGSAKEAPAEAPKAEAKEEKTATETGRERVTKIEKSMKDSWNKWSGKIQDGGKWLTKKMVELGLGAIGGVEKGVKKTGSAIESKKAAVKGYASETRQEAGEITDSFASWAEGASKGLEQGLNTGIDSLNKWAQEKVTQYENIQSTAKGEYENIKSTAKGEVEAGVMNLNIWADGKVQDYNKFKTNVDNTPADLKKAWGKLKTEVAAGVSERFSLLRDGSKNDYARERESIKQKRDSFFGWLNKTRLKIAGTAELHGDVAQLQAIVERQNQMIQELIALQKSKSESRIGEEEDIGVVEYAPKIGE